MGGADAVRRGRTLLVLLESMCACVCVCVKRVKGERAEEEGAQGGRCVIHFFEQHGFHTNPSVLSL